MEVQPAGRVAVGAGVAVHAARKQHRDVVEEEVAVGEGAVQGAEERRGKKHEKIQMILFLMVQESRD